MKGLGENIIEVNIEKNILIVNTIKKGKKILWFYNMI